MNGSAFATLPSNTATVTAPLSPAAALATVPQGITALNSVTGLSMEEDEMSADQLQVGKEGCLLGTVSLLAWSSMCCCLS